MLMINSVELYSINLSRGMVMTSSRLWINGDLGDTRGM